MEILYSLAPIVQKSPSLLVLGSMPSEASLQKQQYYGHPRNHFWPLMMAVLGETDPLNYAMRTELLQKHGVALWDSIRLCRREGSLDSNVRDAVPNDIPSLLNAHPTLRAIAFNGALSKDVYDKHFSREVSITYIVLPSSSPIPRPNFRNYDEKLGAWLCLRAHIAL